MALIICSECGKEFSDKAVACPNCGCPTEEVLKQHTHETVVPVDVAGVDTQKTTILRDYLEKVRLLETDIYTMTASVEELKRDRLIIDTTPMKYVFPPEPKRPKAIETSFISSRFPKNLYVREIEREAAARADALYADFEARHAEWEIEVAEIREKVEKDKERIQNAVAIAEQHNNGIATQIQFINNNIESTRNALNKLYSLGIVHRKYHSLIPISMFCEYLDTGRRTELEGVNGMYDLYESELTARLIVDELKTINLGLNKISSQLGTISNQLTGIQRNQMLIYEAVAEGNSIARSISNQAGTLCKEIATNNALLQETGTQVSALASSAKLIEYNTAATARRVDALAKIGEYEFSLRHPSFPNI